MSDKSKFEPTKVSLVQFKLIKGQVETPEEFIIDKVEGHHLENSLELSFNLDDKLIKVDFSVEIKTESRGENQKEATGQFHLVFIFQIENLNELAKLLGDDTIDLDPSLANALVSITYSTSRGILLTRLQGTALQGFILPIIDPNSLLSNK